MILALPWATRTELAILPKSALQRVALRLGPAPMALGSVVHSLQPVVEVQQRTAPTLSQLEQK